MVCRLSLDCSVSSIGNSQVVGYATVSPQQFTTFALHKEYPYNTILTQYMTSKSLSLHVSNLRNSCSSAIVGYQTERHTINPTASPTCRPMKHGHYHLANCYHQKPSSFITTRSQQLPNITAIVPMNIRLAVNTQTSSRKHIFDGSSSSSVVVNLDRIGRELGRKTHKTLPAMQITLM
jgi:hypothetical protein